MEMPRGSRVQHARDMADRCGNADVSARLGMVVVLGARLSAAPVPPARVLKGGVSSGQLGALHTAASSAKGPMADQLHRVTHAPVIGFVSSTFDAGAGYGTPAFAFSTRPLPHGGALSRVVHWIPKHPLATSRSLHTSIWPLVYLRPSGSSGCHIGLDVLFIVAPHRRLLYDTNRHMPC